MFTFSLSPLHLWILIKLLDLPQDYFYYYYNYNYNNIILSWTELNLQEMMHIQWKIDWHKINICSRKNNEWELDSIKHDRKKSNVVCGRINRISLIDYAIIWVALWKHWIRAGCDYWIFTAVKVLMPVLQFNLICVSRKYVNDQGNLNIAFWM